MSKIGQALWRELFDELEWQLHNRGDVKVDEESIPDVAAGSPTVSLGLF